MTSNSFFSSEDRRGQTSGNNAPIRSQSLRAFAGDPAGSKLPENHGPWGAVGSLRSDQHPPHQFSRAKIEQAIKFVGFQLWRMKPSSEKQVEPA
jgi:hypothetical protein